MSSEKDIPRQKKTAAECALLLHEWVRIVKELNPNKRTENPFCEELEQMTGQLQISEGLLLKDLLHSITLMNRESRINGKGELISTHADLLNALRLILPSTKRIGTREAEALETLKAWFGEENFTYYEASLRLRCSHTTVKRYLQRLLAHGLTRNSPNVKGTGHSCGSPTDHHPSTYKKKPPLFMTRPWKSGKVLMGSPSWGIGREVQPRICKRMWVGSIRLGENNNMSRTSVILVELMRIEKMDIQAAKLDLVQKLLQVSNGTLIEKIGKMLEKEMIVGYTVNGEPLTKAQYNARLEKAERQIEAGEYLTQEELEKEIKNW